VDDVAGAIVAALSMEQTIRQTYNIPGAAPLRFSALLRTAGHALGRSVMLVPVPIELAAAAVRLTRIVSPEQIRRLAEDKSFSYSEAARDFGYAPRTFAEGVSQEAQSLGLV
jgi:nucleoside-diphosphate-sugar epimerase